MEQNLKQQWVDALRSGDYLQTVGKLYDASANEDRGGFCCLGVLCDIAFSKVDRDFTLLDRYNPGADDSYPAVVEDQELSLIGMRHFGIHEQMARRLIDMNDGRFKTEWEGPKPIRTQVSKKLSFKQIANFIERNDLSQPPKRKRNLAHVG